jgi:hypothetical protein
MEKKAAVPMSKGPKRVIAACIVGLLVCALLFLEQIIVGNGDAGMYLGLALSSAASAGLLGRVAWGRFLFSVISVLFAFSLPGIFGPPLPDKVGKACLRRYSVFTLQPGLAGRLPWWQCWPAFYRRPSLGSTGTGFVTRNGRWNR